MFTNKAFVRVVHARTIHGTVQAESAGLCGRHLRPALLRTPPAFLDLTFQFLLTSGWFRQWTRERKENEGGTSFSLALFLKAGFDPEKSLCSPGTSPSHCENGSLPVTLQAEQGLTAAKKSWCTDYHCAYTTANLNKVPVKKLLSILCQGPPLGLGWQNISLVNLMWKELAI